MTDHLMTLYDLKRDVVSRAIARGDYEKFEAGLIRRSVRLGDCVLDVGAHVGFHTLSLCHAVGPKGWVTAFEPDPKNFHMLQHNLAQNSYSDRVTCFRKGLSDRAEKVWLHHGLGNSGDNRTCSVDSLKFGSFITKVKVEMVRYDNMANPAARVDFIKMDVQGGEVKALRGMHRLLNRPTPLTLLMEFWPYGLESHGCSVNDLKGLLNHFSIQHVDADHHRLTLVRDLHSLIPEPEKGNFTNLLCVKNG